MGPNKHCTIGENLKKFDKQKSFKYFLPDLLTGYEGEFVTEDSLLTALQVTNGTCEMGVL